MQESTLLPLLLVTAVAAPVLARLGAWRIGRLVDARPGHARKHVPSLPVVPAAAQSDRAALRFEASVRLAERRAVLLLTDGAADGVCVEASELATRLAVHTEVATALLADWRARLPCRLRVTRSGRLLHDFAVTDLKTAVRDAWHAWPQRVALWLAAILANLGALWWVVVGIAVGVVALRDVLAAETNEARLAMAALGIGEFVGVYLAAQVGAWLVALMAAAPGPKLAPKPEGSPRRTLRIGKGKSATAAPPAVKQKPSEESSGFAWGDLVPSSIDVDGEGCVAVLAIIAVLILVALVAGSLAVVVVWLIGLWRAVARLGEPERNLHPAVWVWRAELASPWERWLPTNDLAVRLVRALRRHLQGRPGDDHLAQRVLARARRQAGMVAALDIALDTTLDLREALDVGSRLVALHGGDLRVSDAGDIAFWFPPEAWQGSAAEPEEVPLEYLGDPAQLLEPKRLAVNVPGLTLDHLGGAMRLAGGPWMTLAVLAIVVLEQATGIPVRGIDLSLAALFCALSPGTLILAAVTMRTVRQSARVGLLRDARRVTVHALRQTLAAGEATFDANLVVGQLTQATARLRGAFAADDYRREVEAMLVDLGLEPSLHGKAGNRWNIQALRARLAALSALGTAESKSAPMGQDDVVFDSAAEGLG